MTFNHDYAKGALIVEKGERHSNPELSELVDAELSSLRKIADAAKALVPVWRDFCEKKGTHERSGHYLWNTNKMYALMDAVRERERL